MLSAKKFAYISLFIVMLGVLVGASEERGDPTWIKPPASGESAGPMIMRPTDTFGGTGDLLETASWIAHNLGPKTLSAPYFWTDIRVRSMNASTKEVHQSMTSDSAGNLYMAWEDRSTSLVFIQIYWSDDDGLTWRPFGYLATYTAELREPSVTVAEGTANMLLLAYIRDDGVQAVPEVASTALTPGPFTITSLPVYTSWEGYAKPEIYTDSYHYNSWYAYVICEGIFNSTTKNVNISAYRSKDYNSSWVDYTTIWGNDDSFEWADPDIAFGTTLKRVLVVCYNKSNEFLYRGWSNDYGVTYQTLWLNNMGTHGVPNKPVDPVIEASVNTDHAIICATCTNDYTDTIGCWKSYDGGEYYPGFYVIWNNHTEPRFGAAICANPTGSSFHLAYTNNNKVYYSKRLQNLSDDWVNPIRVDDVGMCSNFYLDKGIACNWLTDVPGVAWSDLRDGNVDYDTYFDTPTKRTLEADKTSLAAAAGGTVKFHLHAGQSNKYRTFLIIMGASGTSPGTILPGGMKLLPVTWDALSDAALPLVNTPILSNFMGNLDTNGDAMAYMTLPPVPSAAGVEMCFAFALNNPWNFVSNPWKVDLKP